MPSDLQLAKTIRRIAQDAMRESGSSLAIDCWRLRRMVAHGLSNHKDRPDGSFVFKVATFTQI
jgi:hypothetical protein